MTTGTFSNRLKGSVKAFVITVVNTYDYGQTIYDLHLRRELIALSEDIANEAYEHTL